ncbi:GNAT family N-acetyltransferase [Streptomyces mirabilis]|uniref:GNAT family N-acetyltransferase n=1 Tax=Streptomyces mirabilis TaxID=68239 RepID=UPI000AFAA90E
MKTELLGDPFGAHRGLVGHPAGPQGAGLQSAALVVADRGGLDGVLFALPGDESSSARTAPLGGPGLPSRRRMPDNDLAPSSSREPMPSGMLIRELDLSDATVASTVHAVGLRACAVEGEPAWLRRGLASSLLDHLLTKVIDNSEVRVSTGAADQPAVKLYERLGLRRGVDFKPVPDLRMAQFVPHS